MIEISNKKPAVRIFTSDNRFIQGDALEQLKKTAQHEGMEIAIGMPDLHPGKGCPVGAAFLSKGYFYPYLIGNDMGCGMGLWKTTIKKQKIKKDKWIKKLSDLETHLDDDLQSLAKKYGLDFSPSNMALGTIGGGNHFAELLIPEKIFNTREFQNLKLDKQSLCILVHSGSRGIGEEVLRKHIDKYKAGGLSIRTDDGEKYIRQHNDALKWARVNRSLIAQNFVKKLGGRCQSILDFCHNSITRVREGKDCFWLHRKGVTPADNGLIVIPGSRGTFTYLVKPLGEQRLNLWSLPHGAGRKWNRKSCIDRLKGKFNKNSLTHTRLGSRVICDDKEVLFEEAPQAFKDIEKIINDLSNQGLIEVVATFRPLITYKMRKKS